MARRELTEQEAYVKFLEESVSVSKYRPGNMWNAVRDYDGGSLKTTSDENDAELSEVRKKITKLNKTDALYDSGETKAEEDADDTITEDGEYTDGIEDPEAYAGNAEEADDTELPDDDYIGDHPDVEDESSPESLELAAAAQEDCESCGEKIEEIYKQLGVSPLALLEEDEELADDIELTEHENRVLEQLIREMDEVDAENGAEEDEFLDDVTADDDDGDVEVDSDDAEDADDSDDDDDDVDNDDDSDDVELPE